MLRASATAHWFTWSLGGLALAAWAAWIALQHSAYRELFGHEGFTVDGIPPLVRLGAFLAGWILMTAAMMLPANLPRLHQMFGRPPDSRTNRGFIGLTMLGYFAPWTLYGLLVYLGDIPVHGATAPGATLHSYAHLIAPITVLAAGLYQLTPSKRRALERCRLAPGAASGAGGHPMIDGGAFRSGLHLGIDCMRSCWALMLLMAAVGHNRLDAIVLLSGVMVAERLAPAGPRLARAVGVALIAAGLVWLIAAASTGHSHHHG